MPQKQYNNLTTGQWLMAFWFAHWHLARMPAATADDRLRRAAWCRDHCNSFAARWFILALVLMLIQGSPLGFLFVSHGLPLLIPLFLFAFIAAIGHLAWQLIAQEKAGPPKIDPPQDWGGGDP